MAEMWVVQVSYWSKKVGVVRCKQMEVDNMGGKEESKEDMASAARVLLNYCL